MLNKDKSCNSVRSYERKSSIYAKAQVGTHVYVFVEFAQTNISTSSHKKQLSRSRFLSQMSYFTKL